MRERGSNVIKGVERLAYPLFTPPDYGWSYNSMHHHTFPDWDVMCKIRSCLSMQRGVVPYL